MKSAAVVTRSLLDEVLKNFFLSAPGCSCLPSDTFIASSSLSLCASTFCSTLAASSSTITFRPLIVTRLKTGGGQNPGDGDSKSRSLSKLAMEFS